MDYEEELGKIYCLIEPVFHGNKFLANNVIAQKLTLESVKRIKSYGYDCEAEDQANRGGGHGLWWELIKYFWQLKDVISIIITTVSSIRIFIRTSINRKSKQLKPCFKLSLRIKSISPGQASAYGFEISDKLTGLKFLSQDISDWLSKKYPLYIFDQAISASLSSKSFRVFLSQPFIKVNRINNYRLLKILNKIDERNNLEIIIGFARFKFIKRSFSYYESEGNLWTGSGNTKHFYTLISTQLITRYPKPNDSKLKVLIGRIRYKLKIRTRLAIPLRFLLRDKKL